MKLEKCVWISIFKANEYGVQKTAGGIMSAGFAQRISTVNRPGSRVGTAASGANAMRAVTAYNYVRLSFFIGS
jgi:hypothetical protein